MKAAQGFVRGKGLTVEDITFREVSEEYVYVTKQEIGKPVEELIDGVVDVLTSLSFPINMPGAPIHLNIFALFIP